MLNPHWSNLTILELGFDVPYSNDVFPDNGNVRKKLESFIESNRTGVELNAPVYNPDIGLREYYARLKAISTENTIGEISNLRLIDGELLCDFTLHENLDIELSNYYLSIRAITRTTRHPDYIDMLEVYAIDLRKIPDTESPGTSLHFRTS